MITAELIKTLSTIQAEIVEDLERYTNQPEAKSYIVTKLNNQINKIEFCINLLTEETTNRNKHAEKQKAKEKQKTLLIDKLQIICLLHGIDDLSYYLQWSRDMLLNELKARRNPQPCTRSYLIGKVLTPNAEKLLQEIEALETIKTIQLPIAHMFNNGEKPVQLGTTNKPVLKFN